jgi:hypothetical protein
VLEIEYVGLILSNESRMKSHQEKMVAEMNFYREEWQANEDKETS